MSLIIFSPFWVFLLENHSFGGPESASINLRGHTSDITAIAYGPQGEILVSCAEDKTARIWDTRSGKAIQVMKGHVDHLTAIACSPDGKRIAVSSKGLIIIHTLGREVD